MDPPPPTQVTEPPPNIFVNSDGSPLQIFAEAGHIYNRPQLVRRLKRFGATICSDPKNAQIILVNPESTQGRIFVRNWGDDENKVVLDSAWARKCFDEQKIFLEDEEYGGYVVIDDGLPIEDENDGESGGENANPLPTPRATPAELPLSRSRAPDRPASIPPRQQSAAPMVQPQVPLPPPRLTPDIPPPSTPSFNGMDMAAMAQFMQQFATPPGMPQNAQMPLGMMQQQATMLNMFPYNIPQQNIQSDPFWLAVRDTMMNKGLYPAQTQTTPSQLPHNVYSQQSLVSSPVQQQVLPFPPIPSAENSFDSYPDSPPRQPSVRPKKHRASSPSSKRRKTSSSSFQEASSSSKQSKPNGAKMGPPAERKLFKKRSGRDLAFFVQVGGHNRFSLVQSIKKNGGNIVSNITEADYVILYQTPGKTDKVHESFLHQAISADLPAVSARFVTDCLERNSLLDPTPYLFVEPIKAKRKRPVVRSISPISPESEDEDDEQDSRQRSFTNGHDQFEDSHMQMEDPEPLRISIPMPGQSMEKPNSTASITSSTYSYTNGTSPQQSPKKRGRPKRAEQPLTIKTVNIRPKPVPAGPQSPIAPTFQMAIPWGNGYKFSREEDEFAIAYAKVLVERDHRASLGSISAAVHRKVPHHTMKSWRTHLQVLYGNDLDEWRKRAGIAYRKALLAKQNSSTPVASSSHTPSRVCEVSASDAEEPPPSTRASTISASPIPEQPPRVHINGNGKDTNQVIQSALEADLEAISRFFAEGNDDQTESEDVIWAKLTSQASCNTENSWEIFYQKHSNEVQTRYQRLVDMQG
ncbi:hypothetical protein BDN70DRAFT_573065 [Pholiota conissans]|uniref:BRCT domain-containing protein n=1 Tax=Pholiota conissans TaxID=109636 RepID=A0A9P5Z3U9_9AGAR|nr:hypothetical protein BDN70DRAFT_573065 [Pholiota conissans]